jgi:hypothetical protein
MKKLFLILAFVTLACGAPAAMTENRHAVIANPTAQSPHIGVVIAESINVRLGANASATNAGVVYNGDTIYFDDCVKSYSGGELTEIWLHRTDGKFVNAFWFGTWHIAFDGC